MSANALSPTVSKGIISSTPTAPYESASFDTEMDGNSASNASGNVGKSEKVEVSGAAPDIDAEAAAAAPASVSAPVSPHPYTGIRWYLLLTGMYLTAFLYGLDNTIVANIQGSVIVEFGHVEQLSWLGSGFPLGGVATILPIGKGFGIFDNKWLYIFSIVVFSVGSAICGAAPDMNALIVGRVIGGIGGGGIYLGVLNLLSRFTTIRERSNYIGVLGLIWGAGTILGPVIGGAFADSTATWRWSFYINLVLVGLCCPIYFIFIPSTNPQPLVPFTRKVASLDWVGAALNAGIYTCWIIGLQFGGTTWAWSDGRTITIFTVLGVLIVVFCFQQYFSIFTKAEARIFPVMFLKRRTPMLIFVATSAVTAAIFVPIFYIPVYFQFVHGDSGIESAVRLLPLVLLLVSSSVVSGYLLPIIGYYMPFFLIGGLIAVTGSALMFNVTPSTSPSYIYGAAALLGLAGGIGTSKGYSLLPALLLAPSTHHTATSRAPEPHYIPASIAFLNVSQIGSVLHALAISGAVFQNVAYKGLLVVFEKNGLHFGQAEVRAAVAGTKSVIFERLTPEIRIQAINAIVKSISDVYALCISASSLLVVVSLGLRCERLFQKPKIVPVAQTAEEAEAETFAEAESKGEGDLARGRGGVRDTETETETTVTEEK